MASSSSTTASPALLSMPAELRNMVYGYLWTGPLVVYIMAQYGKPVTVQALKKPLRLLLVCKHIHSELIAIVHGAPVILRVWKGSYSHAATPDAIGRSDDCTGISLPQARLLITPAVFARVIDIRLTLTTFSHINDDSLIHIYNRAFGFLEEEEGGLSIDLLPSALKKVTLVARGDTDYNPTVRNLLETFCNRLLNHPNLNTVTELNEGRKTLAFDISS